MLVLDNKLKITLVMGDTGNVRLKLDNYKLCEGDEVHFAAVRKNLDGTKELVIEKCMKQFDAEGGCDIKFEEKDTLMLEPNSYLYDIRVLTRDGIRDTIIESRHFVVKEGYANEIKC